MATILPIPQEYVLSSDAPVWDAGKRTPPYERYTGKVNDVGLKEKETIPAGGVTELWLDPSGFICKLRLCNGAADRDPNSVYANQIRKQKVNKGWIPANGCAKFSIGRGNLPPDIMRLNCSGKERGLCECTEELKRRRQERHNALMASKEEAAKTEVAKQTELLRDSMTRGKRR